MNTIEKFNSFLPQISSTSYVGTVLAVGHTAVNKIHTNSLPSWGLHFSGGSQIEDK